MSRNIGPLGAALLSLLVAACGATGTPQLTASARTSNAVPTAAFSTPTISRGPQSTTTAEPTTPSAAGVVCTGDDLLWPLLPQPAQAYALSWLEGLEAERLALLEEAMAPEGTYADAVTVARLSGLPAISEHIGNFHSDMVGHFFRVRAWGEGDHHHDYVRLRWILCRANDARIVLEGEDILVLDDSGLIREVTRFTDS